MARLWDAEGSDAVCDSQQCLWRELRPGSLVSQSVQHLRGLVELHEQDPLAIKN